MAIKKVAPVKKLATLKEAFEKSSFDKEKPGEKEDSAADKKTDKKQMPAFIKAAKKKK